MTSIMLEAETIYFIKKTYISRATAYSIALFYIRKTGRATNRRNENRAENQLREGFAGLAASVSACIFSHHQSYAPKFPLTNIN